MTHTQEWNELATPHTAMREEAFNAGMDNPQCPWILTQFDVWMKNPFYHGPSVPHPEDDYPED